MSIMNDSNVIVSVVKSLEDAVCDISTIDAECDLSSMTWSEGLSVSVRHVRARILIMSLFHVMTRISIILLTLEKYET